MNLRDLRHRPHNLQLRRIPTDVFDEYGQPQSQTLKYLNKSFIEAQGSILTRDIVIAITNRRRKTLLGAATTPCGQSRNKREGKYAGKTCYDWQYVTGWGMAGYEGQPRHNRSKYLCLRGVV
jgi:hypothetical protein